MWWWFCWYCWWWISDVKDGVNDENFDDARYIDDVDDVCYSVNGDGNVVNGVNEIDGDDDDNDNDDDNDEDDDAVDDDNHDVF